MTNLNNMIAVVYSNGAVRRRNCQTTVYPTKEALGIVTTLKAWRQYLKFMRKPNSMPGIHVDSDITGEQLVQDAWEIINHKY